MNFSFKRFEGSDDDIHFYSGFQNASSYKEFMTLVLFHAENMSYWSKNLRGNLPNGDEDSTQTANVSTGHTNRALSKEDELFLTLQDCVWISHCSILPTYSTFPMLLLQEYLHHG